MQTISKYDPPRNPGSRRPDRMILDVSPRQLYSRRPDILALNIAEYWTWNALRCSGSSYRGLEGRADCIASKAKARMFLDLARDLRQQFRLTR